MIGVAIDTLGSPNMKKLLLVGLNDVRLAFRDRTALIMMLLAPFLLTLGLGFVTGRFSGGASSGLSPIPVVLVNQDGGRLGAALVGLFQSQNLNGLANPSLSDDPAAACRAVDGNQAAAAIIIPGGFTDSLLPASGQTGSQTVVPIELYANPTAPTSVGIVKTIVAEFLGRVEVGRVGTQVIVAQLISNNLIQTQDAGQVGRRLALQLENLPGDSAAIRLTKNAQAGATAAFDPLALIAPGMALMFLMYTASYGGRALLAERTQGTLSRLLVSPTTVTQVLGGKIFGILLTGVAQVSILIVATTLLFQLKWGDPLAVLALVLTAVFAAVGWGLLITAIAKTPTQVSNIGAALMLVFGLLGGSFFSLQNTPIWFQRLSQITPNAWGLDGFTTLAMGGGLGDILRPVLALLAMGAALFALAVVLFNRRGLMEA
jgi:ABC-2 type transport system permease protein